MLKYNLGTRDVFVGICLELSENFQKFSDRKIFKRNDSRKIIVENKNRCICIGYSDFYFVLIEQIIVY